jgi:hypothetical protein
VLREHKILQWQVPRMAVPVAVAVTPVVAVAVAVTKVAVAMAAVAAAVVGCHGSGGGGGGGIGGCGTPRGGLLGGLVSAVGRVASSPLLGSGKGGCEDHGKCGGGICGE